MNVLIIDDEESLRFTFKCFLSTEGYNVFTACDYEEGREKILEEKPDLIFADIVLGDKTGIDLLRFIKEMGFNSPVVMVTGYPSLETASEAVRLGAFDYISKPVEKQILLHTARKALDYKRITDENENYRSNLEAIFSSVKDGIITVDRDLTVMQLNEAAKEICLFSGFFDGNTLKSLSDRCYGKECINALEKTLDTGVPCELHRLECHRESRRGQVVTINITPLIKKGKDLLGAVMVIRDETGLVEMERKMEGRDKFHNITGKSDRMKEIYSLLEKLSPTPTTVLITGESGTGKELVAEALHYKSHRKDKPFIKVNCSALPENLLESELFGHVKGAFTGAIKDKKGRFEMAEGGTIFLDEVGDISDALQVRLLRVLQEKEFERLGEGKTVKADMRIIAATNQSLLEKVRAGEFREDLYYRLKVVEISLPPLRERREDIPLLTDHFIEKYNKKLGKNIKSLSRNVQRIFMDYPWPGNIRELEHAIEHAFILCSSSVITIDGLPVELKLFSPKDLMTTHSSIVIPCKSLKLSADDEESKIRDALEKNRWNKAKTAKILGMDRTTLYRKMAMYGIS